MEIDSAMASAQAGRRGALPRGRVLHLDCRREPGREYLLYVPGTGGDRAPLFVPVHGISRNVGEHAALFAPYCEQRGVVLVAPVFRDGQSRDYQRLGRSGRGPRADAALDAILVEAAELTGVDPARFHLFGFSGGAQFAHRYVMAHPERIAGAVIAAAGWYTFPDPYTRYPYGIRPSRDLPGVRFDPEEFLTVPMTVIVGDQDTTSVDLRRTERVDRQQGETRLERAQHWVAAMRRAAREYRLEPRVTLTTIRGGDHVFASLMAADGLGDLTFAALFGAPETNGDGGGRG